jgi:hypothetical protein
MFMAISIGIYICGGRHFESIGKKLWLLLSLAQWWELAMMKLLTSTPFETE